MVKSHYKSSTIADRAPGGDQLTEYDRAHLKLYLRMLDAEEAGAEWTDVAAQLLEVEPQREPDKAKGRYETHLARAKWMRDGGYEHLLKG